MGIGNRRIHQRPGSTQPTSGCFNKVCFYWQAGRCSRHPCPYLHGEPLHAPSSNRSHHQNPNPIPNRSRSLVWRNPNPKRWKGGGGPQINKICNLFVDGSCYGDGCKYLHSWFVGDDFSLVTSLQGHQKAITGIALPSGTDKLYSGSKDESVRVWDCHSGQCVGVINMGGEVGCMTSEGPWIFVGIPNAVKAWNTQTATELSLDGPTGQVYALEFGNEMLFAGIQDGRILVWKFSVVGNCFEPAASLTGHRFAVVSLVVGAARLYSGSMDNTIRVWDLTTLQCIHTLTDHTSVVMSVLCWDYFLLSCSLDKTIKVWAATESGKLEVTYIHNEEHLMHTQYRTLLYSELWQRKLGCAVDNNLGMLNATMFCCASLLNICCSSHGVLTLCGMHDAQAKPVLFCACNDNSVRLFELPSFSERGKIFTKEEVRSIQIGPGGLFFTGDGTGELKVWKWVLNEVASA